MRSSLISPLLIAALGCTLGGPSTPFNSRFTVTPGQQFTILPPNTDPSAFESPPAVSSGAIVFDSVRDLPLPIPAGWAPLQNFYFTARLPGSAVIHFQRSPSDPGIFDLVSVP